MRMCYILLMGCLGCGSDAVPAISTQPIDWGFVPCGSLSAQPRVLELGNTGSDPYTFQASFEKFINQPFYVDQEAGVGPANGSVPLLVGVRFAIPEAPSLPAELRDVLEVRTDADDTVHRIAVVVHAQGAIIEASGGAIDFGSVAVSTTS